MNRNDLAQLLLVASDQAYQAGRPVLEGERLGADDPLSFFDDTPWYVDPIIGGQPRPPQLFEDKLGGFHVAVPPRADDETGFKAVIYLDPVAKQIIVAFAGTDGVSPSGLLDWTANVKLGWNQWVLARTALLQDLNNVLASLGSSETEVHFTGQSLGGALAEYAAFDFARQPLVTSAVRQRTTLTTFNGLGSVAGLLKYGGASAEDVRNFGGLGSINHYSVQNDIVHRLGADNVGTATSPLIYTHLGGPSTEYEFQFLSGRTDPLTGRALSLSVVDAHRIESGFYLPFLQASRAGDLRFFNAAMAKSVQGIELGSLQEKVAALTFFLNDRGVSTETAARYRLTGGLILALAGASEDELRPLAEPLIDALAASGDLLPETASYLKKDGIRFATKFTDQYRKSAAEYLLSAMVLEKLNAAGVPSATDLQAVKQLLADAGVQAAASMNVSPEVYSTVKAVVIQRAALNLRLIDLSDATNDPFLRSLQITPEEIAQLRDLGSGAVSQQKFLANKMQIVTDLLAARATTMPGSEGAVSAGIAEITGRISSWFLDSTVVRGEAQRLENEAAVAQVMLEVYRRIGAAIGNGYEQFQAKITDTFEWGAAVSRSTIDAFIKGFQAIRQGLQSSGQRPVGLSEIETGLHEVESILEYAGQRGVIRPYAMTNPFNDSDFDPDTAPMPDSTITDCGAKSYTVFLAYAAGEGGQHIRIKLDGADAADLKVIAGGATVTRQPICAIA